MEGNVFIAEKYLTSPKFPTNDMELKTNILLHAY